MSPDDVYLEKQAKAEEEKLQKKIQALSDSDRKEIYDKGNRDPSVGGAETYRMSPGRLKSTRVSCFSRCKGLELLDVQSKTQDASCLPALKMSDIEPTIPVTAVQISAAGTEHRFISPRSTSYRWITVMCVCSPQEAYRCSTASSPPTVWFTSEPCAV